jgi:hypothetical protein
MTRDARFIIIATLLLINVVGCTFSEPSRYAATGTVTMDGSSAPYVVVMFHSVSSGSTAGGSGSTDQAGKFTVGEDGKNTGFPSGDYKVTFSQTLVNGKPTLAGGGGKKSVEETVPSEREAVADDFRDPQKTPITATIGSGTNTFTFDIKKK